MKMIPKELQQGGLGLHLELAILAVNGKVDLDFQWEVPPSALRRASSIARRVKTSIISFR
jgi:hypothetical protein